MGNMFVGNDSFRSTGESDQLNQEGGDSMLLGVKHTRMLKLWQQQLR